MRFARRQHRRQRLDVELHLARGAARLHDRVGDDQADHLADVFHLVAARRWARRATKVASIGSPGMSCASTTPRTPGMASAARGIDAAQAAMRHGRKDGRRVQRALHLGDVIDIGRGAGHLRAGAFVGARAPAAGPARLGVRRLRAGREVAFARIGRAAGPPPVRR